MNHHWAKLVTTVVLWVTIALAGFGAAVWQLWNSLLPDIFHLPEIGYWQACGLMCLCWLLFGGWRWSALSGGGRTMSRRTLTNGEREALCAVMREKYETNT